MPNSFRMQTLLSFLTLAVIFTGCRTPPAPPRLDPEIERQVAAARSACAAGAIERAAESFERALQRARLIDDTPEIARCAYNLAACLAMLRQWDAAGIRLNEAQAACAEPKKTPAEFTLLRAKIARGAGRTNDAISIAHAWLAETPPKSTAKIHRLFQVFFGELLYETGEFDAARAVLAQIPADAHEKEMDILTRADLFRLQARLACQADARQDAAGLYDDAANTYRAAMRYRLMAECLADSGRAWAAVGNLENAGDRMYRAARSLYEQNQLETACALVKEALPLVKDNAVMQELLKPPAAQPISSPVLSE